MHTYSVFVLTIAGTLNTAHAVGPSRNLYAQADLMDASSTHVDMRYRVQVLV
jgi:hypothetical protein